MRVKLLEDYNLGSLLRYKGEIIEVDAQLGAWMVEHRKAEALEEEEKQEPRPVRRKRQEADE